MGNCTGVQKFAKTWPGQYQLVQKVKLWKSDETKELSEQIIEIFSKILQKYALSEDDTIHFIRTLRSYLHGFALLEMDDAFGLPQELEKKLFNRVKYNFDRFGF